MKAKKPDLFKAKRGAIVKAPKDTTIIRLRIDDNVLNWFREQVHQAGGGDCEELINAGLRHYIQQQNSVLEKTMRRVIREELQSMMSQAA